MGKHEVTCAWKGDMEFAASIGGHTVTMDADQESGGHDEGCRPKPLVLAALAGCSGMDVVSILRKMREPVTWFNMRVEGVMADELPKPYTAIKIVYEFKAADGLKDANVRKAVDLSQERYCGVGALLKRAVPVTYEVVYL